LNFSKITFEVTVFPFFFPFSAQGGGGDRSVIIWFILFCFGKAIIYEVGREKKRDRKKRMRNPIFKKYQE
jgi:hypothetical protein